METVSAFIKINQSIIEDIKQELRLQGHYLTGALEKSIENIEEIINNDIILGAVENLYGKYVEQGVPSGKIPFQEGSGKKSSKYIAGLTQYAKTRMGVSDKEALSIAFAIAKKHKGGGMPTESSKQYSENGKRIQAVKDVFEKNDEKYLAAIDKAAVAELDNLFSKVK